MLEMHSHYMLSLLCHVQIRIILPIASVVLQAMLCAVPVADSPLHTGER